MSILRRAILLLLPFTCVAWMTASAQEGAIIVSELSSDLSELEGLGHDISPTLRQASYELSSVNEVATLDEWLDESKFSKGESWGYGDSLCPGWQLDADLLVWRLEHRGSDYAITTNNGALAVGSGAVRHLEMDWDPGFRTRLGYRTESGWQFGLGYTFFHSEQADAVAAPGGGNLWATRSHPDFFEQAANATANGEFDLNMLDLDSRYPVHVNDCFALELFGGFRWAEIDQDLIIGYDGVDFTNGQVTDRLSMSGFGARVGGEAHWKLNCNWSVYGNAAGSVLYGRFDRTLNETNLNGADTIVDIQDSYGRPVSVVEAAIGLHWNFRDAVQFRGGYELADWIGMVDRGMFTDNTHEGLYAPISDNLLLHGMFLRMTFTR